MTTGQGHLMIKTALHAGRIMIENGSEVARWKIRSTELRLTRVIPIVKCT